MIYVDNAFIPATIGRITSRWCHLTAFPQNEAELIKFGKKIGLKAAWLQCHDLIHFDVTEGMRKKAIAAGAIGIDCQQLVRMKQEDRKNNPRVAQR